MPNPEPGQDFEHLTRSSSWQLLPLLLAAGALGTKLFYFISTYAVNVFYFDPWDYLTPLFQGRDSFAHLFLWQHGPHRMGVGLISLRFLYAATHWSTRDESFLVGTTVFLAMLLAVWLKYRLFGTFAYTDIAIPLIFLTLIQFETFLSPPGYGAFPLLLVLLYCLALLVRNHLFRYALILAITFLLIYTGYGIFMGAITLGLFALDAFGRVRRISSIPMRYSIPGFLVAAVLLASFFLHYTFAPGVGCFVFPYRPLVSYPQFVALMFSTFLGPTRPVVLVTAGGAVALLFAAATFSVVACRFFNCREDVSARNTQLITLVLLAYSLLFASNAAIGRVCLGLPDAAQASRYVTFMIPAYLSIYFFLLSFSPVILRKIALGLFLVVLSPGGLMIPNWAGHQVTDGKLAWATCYLRTENITVCDSSTRFPLYPDPERIGMRQKLEYLKQHHLSFFYSLK